MVLRYRDRRDAGRRLAASLAGYTDRADVVVLALPRGGVPVAYEVARALRAPLDVFLVRKLGMPGQEELAMGAIASGGVVEVNPEVVAYGIPRAVIEQVTARERIELERRERVFRAGRPPHQLAGRVVIVVDDGLATGSTMRAALKALRLSRPARVVVAVPVGADSSCDDLRELADEVVCPLTPDPLHAVGMWYEDFEQTGDDEVVGLLQLAARERGADLPASQAPAPPRPGDRRDPRSAPERRREAKGSP